MQKLNVLTSVNILKDRVVLWAKENNIENYIFLESFNLPSTKMLKNNDIAILFGDFLACFSFLNENNTGIKKVYVLCHKAKKLIESCESDKEIKVEVIKRYHLFKRSKIEKPLPNIIKDKVRLVYAGRITQAKNIKIFVKLANQLQKINPQISVKFFGEYDDFLNIDFNAKKLIYSYQAEVEKCISDLDWINPPSFTHELSATEWPLKLEPQDVVVNLSTYWMDDFSVSLAQAQEIGTPIICTDIGGLSDLTGKNIIKVPSYLFDSEFVPESNDVDAIKANNIFEFIIENKDLGKVENVERKTNLKLPDFRNLKLNQVFDYKNTFEGKTFFKKYLDVWNHSSALPKPILFLVSNEQNHWLSLKTISEHIKLFWLSYQQKGFAVEMVNVDEALDKKYISRLGSYHFIVAPSLSLNAIKVMKLIRNSLGLKTPFVAYAHELPSVFFSSLKIRELGTFFTENDMMITQCESDLKLTKLSFENINAQMIPSCFVLNKEIEPQTYNIKNLYYVGRISEQKGLHYLFWSLSLIKDVFIKKNIKVNIFGIHDHLGMPNWGDGGGLYLDFLGDLIQDLQLEEIITFHGFSSKANWGEFVISNHGAGIFPSLHSDENFGVAPFDLLNEGIPVVLTKWGGFQDLAKYYEPLVKSNNVYLSSKGPYLNPNELASTLLELLNYDQSKLKPFRSRLEINEWVDKVVFANNKCPERLDFSKFAKGVIDKLKFSSNISIKARGWALNGVMYSGPSDPAYLIACEIYGASKNMNSVEKEYILAPWVKSLKNGFEVNDPIKGHFILNDIETLFELGLAFKKSF